MNPIRFTAIILFSILLIILILVTSAINMLLRAAIR